MSLMKNTMRDPTPRNGKPFGEVNRGRGYERESNVQALIDSKPKC